MNAHQLCLLTCLIASLVNPVQMKERPPKTPRLRPLRLRFLSPGRIVGYGLTDRPKVTGWSACEMVDPIDQI